MGSFSFLKEPDLFLSFIPSFQDNLLAAVIVYSNADTDRSQILLDNKGKAGVYKWTHKESGKLYIGSSNDLAVRFRFYYSISYLTRYNKSYINNALFLYGYSAFSLTILEYIDISNLSKDEARKLILEREQHYIDTLVPEYNILKVAGSSLGFLLSEKTKGLMRKPKSEETKKLMRKPKSEETKKKMSLAFLGRKHKPETKALMSIVKSKKVYIYIKDSLLNEIILFKSFDSCAETAKYFNCSTMTITRYIDSNKFYKKIFILSSKYLDI